MTEELRNKLSKVYALVNRGATEGERAAAQKALDRIVEKYNIDPSDLDQDEGQRGNLYCLWCQQSGIKKGYYLCFVNWCICPDCVEEGLNAFIEHKAFGFHYRIGLEVDFKKNGKGKKELCYLDMNHVKFYPQKDVAYGISFKELLIAQKLLK